MRTLLSKHTGSEKSRAPPTEPRGWSSRGFCKGQTNELLLAPQFAVCGSLVKKLSPLESALLKGAAQPGGLRLGPFISVGLEGRCDVKHWNSISDGEMKKLTQHQAVIKVFGQLKLKSSADGSASQSQRSTAKDSGFSLR